MKKRILLFTAIAGMSYLIFSSHSAGPTTVKYDCTGAETGLGNPTGCSAPGVPCHGAVGAPTTGIQIAIALDSAGIPRHYYTGGATYTVKITGTNTTTSNLPMFGFQLGAIKGSVAMTTPVNVGTWITPYPSGTHDSLAWPGNFVVNLMEHGMRLSPATGTGSTGTTYIDSFTWTAPPAGTGTISFWCALNAVNNNGGADAGDLWNTNHVIITEGRASVEGLASLSGNLNVKAYPNPIGNSLNLQTDNAGAYSVQVYDLSGRCVVNKQITVNGAPASINSSIWEPGFYQVVVEKDGKMQVIPVVKR